MTASRILQSASAAARLQQARTWINELTPLSPLTILGDSQQAVEEFSRSIAKDRDAFIGVRRMTLSTFAYQVALTELARAGLTLHPKLAREAVMARVLHERSGAELGPLEPIAQGPGLVRAMTATFDECRRHRVAADDLSNVEETGSVLSRLYEDYELVVKEKALADRSVVFRVAARVLADSRVKPTEAFVLLDLSLEAPLDAELVAAIAGSSRTQTVLATLAHGDHRSQRFLQNSLGVEAEQIPFDPLDPAVPEALQDLKRHLFAESSPEPRDPREEPLDEVLILSASGEAQECVELARRIKLEASRGIPFDSMAVLLRSPEEYTPLIEDAFDRAGIPSYFESGTKRPDPSGRAFLSLLDCASEDLSARSFAEYLSLSQIPRLNAEGQSEPSEKLEPGKDRLWVAPRHALAPAISTPLPEQLDLFAPPEKHVAPEKLPEIEGSLRAPWRWEKLLVDAAVIGGYERWERRLAGLSREITLRIDDLEDPDGAFADALRQQEQDLEHLRKFALPMLQHLDTLPHEALWGEWLDRLEYLASHFLARPEGVLALLKELRPMGEVGPVGLFEVREVLSERLTLLSQEPQGYRYGRVFVAPLDAVRGLSFELILVPGLAERVFPRKIVEDPLLLDRDRKRLGKDLVLQRDRTERERLALHLAVGAATRKIVFSYPSIDIAKGRSRVPSFYLLEVARASQGTLPDFETLERDAFARSGARLGWPAPRDRSAAIDETEYDLSVLADALRAESSDDSVTGAGRYLVNVNGYLARSLRARYQRAMGGKFTSSDGFIEPSKEGRDALARFRLDTHPYSVTGLEKYAGCPYRFYLNALLRLRPRDHIETLTHLDPLTIGSIVHDTQFHILGRLRSENLLPLRPDNIEEALRVFELVFRESSHRFYEELAPAIDRIWEDEMYRIRIDLRGWLQRNAQAADGFVPHRREFTFGMRPHGPADPESTTELAVLPNGLRLRGAIDLVERDSDGRIRITDHKSGRAWVPKSSVVNGGQTLQPILYSLAYEALTNESVALARLYYCTEKGGYEERVMRPDGEALEIVAEFQRRLDEIIEDGFFPASPKPPLGCRFCDYLAVCGTRAEIDAKRKQHDPRLSPLNWLRNLT